MTATNSSVWDCLIVSAALLVLLLPLAKPSHVISGKPPWTYCGSTDFDDASTDIDYPVWVWTFSETFDVQPVTYNITFEARQFIPGGRVNITLAGVTTKHKLCDITIGGCPIQAGSSFTFSFNRTYQGMREDGKFSITSKNKTVLYTCVIFHGNTWTGTPAPEPSPACPSSDGHTCISYD